MSIRFIKKNIHISKNFKNLTNPTILKGCVSACHKVKRGKKKREKKNRCGLNEIHVYFSLKDTS